MKICKFKPLTNEREVEYIEQLMEGIFHLSEIDEIRAVDYNIKI